MESHGQSDRYSAKRALLKSPTYSRDERIAVRLSEERWMRRGGKGKIVKRKRQEHVGMLGVGRSFFQCV
jgi:hypothetical protein